MFTQMGTSGNLPFCFLYLNIYKHKYIQIQSQHKCQYTMEIWRDDPTNLSRPTWDTFALPFYQKDEPGRGRTCNLQIRSLTRFHCATGPYIIIPYSLFLSFARRLPRLPYSYPIIGRFISSRIHPFPSEHGSKDA